MRTIRTAVALVLCLLLTGTACATETYVYADEDGQIADPTVYQGDRSSVYLQILQARSEAIHAYQDRKIEFTENQTDYVIPCCPVGLSDLTGDGVPELLILEYAEDEMRGDLLVYSADNGTGSCILYVPGITWPDYDDLMGFEIYKTSGGLLVRYFEMELEWKRQFDFSSGYGLYEPRNSLMLEVELSGESEDRYYLNGAQVSEDTYRVVEKELDKSREQCISHYIADDRQSYGFHYTWEQAAAALNGETDLPGQQSEQTGSRETYGLTTDRLATRKGPGTQYAGGGTYNVKNQYIKVLAKAWDGSIWWIKCEIPYHGQIRVLWTGYKRFDHSSFNLDDLPEEVWE